MTYTQTTWVDDSAPAINATDLNHMEAGIAAALPTFNVISSYGAKANGVTDDTTAIQNAVNACHSAGGGIVFFPPGNYIVSSAVVVYDQMVLLGSGRWASHLTLANGSNSDVFASPDDGVQRYWLQIKNLGIDGNAANQSGGTAILNIRGMNEATVEGCRLVNPYADAIRVGQATGGIFNTVPQIQHNLIRGDSTHTTGNGIDLNSGSSDCQVIGNDIGFFTSGCGILLSGHNGGELVGNHCWQNKFGYQLFAASRTRVVGCLADLSKQYGFVIQNANDTQVIGCQAREGSQTAANTYDGFILQGTSSPNTCFDTVFTGCRGMGSQQRYGLNIDQYANQVQVSSSDWQGNTSGGYRVGATGTVNINIFDQLPVDPLAVASGLAAWSWNPLISDANTSPSTGTVYLTAVYVPPGKTLTGVAFATNPGGANSVTSFFVGLAGPTGTMLAQSSAFGSFPTTEGILQFAFSATYTTNLTDSPSGLYYVVALIGASGGSNPGFLKGFGNVGVGTPISGKPTLSGSGSTTGQTALPANGSGIVGGVTNIGQSYWGGVY